MIGATVDRWGGTGSCTNCAVMEQEVQKTQEKQRVVYSALTEQMSGMSAPVHKIDNLETLAPEN